MKNLLKGYVLGLLTMFFLTCGFVFANDSKNIDVFLNKIKVFANGIEVKADNILYNGRTYVPLRAVSEEIGLDVDYDEKTNIVKIKSNNDLKINYLYYLEELKYNLEIEKEIANGQFHSNLGLLKPPSETLWVLDTITLQSNRREAKSNFILKNFTTENIIYEYLIYNSNDEIKELLNNYKTLSIKGFDYYIEASNKRAFDNPNDYISINTDFWKLKGKGNSSIDEVILDIIKKINSLTKSK